MKQKKELLAMVIVSIFLGIILSVQFKTVNKTVGEGALPTQRAQQLALELKKVQGERETQSKRIDELEEKIKSYEKGEADKNIYAENLYKDTERYRSLAGYTDLEGPGVIMEIKDPDENLEYGYMLIDELELVLQTISVLNVADAEAISINDQRYTAFTEIERAADYIMINGVPTNTPIIIKAIGDPKTLESALSIKGGMVEYLRDYSGYRVQVSQENNIQIPKYKKIKEFIYSNPVEENDD